MLKYGSVQNLSYIAKKLCDSKMLLLVQFLTFLVLLHQPEAAEGAIYQNYRLEALCGEGQQKKSLDLDSQPHVFTFNTTNTELLKCHLELHLSDTLGFSVFTEVMKLDSSEDCARDFVQFGR